MEILNAIILGVIQGLTEFLPISSSGHLVITEHILGVTSSGVAMEIWLHFGTLVAVVAYFYKQLRDIAVALFIPGTDASGENRRLLIALITGTLPIVFIGLLFKSQIEGAFSSPYFASCMLLVTGVILLVSVLAKNKDRDVGPLRGFFVGLAQMVAILPGISRSGSTITCAMLLGVKPSKAAEFSFLLAVPAVAGAFLLELMSTGGHLLEAGQIPAYAVGTVASFLFGILSIHYLLRIIKKGKFFFFGFYCLVAGTISLLYLR